MNQSNLPPIEQLTPSVSTQNMPIHRRILQSNTAQYLLIAFYAMLSAMNNVIFVFPNHFAPAGINGIATMVQYAFGFQMGYLSLIINVPMVIVAFFVLKKGYAVRSLIFTVVFSVTLLLCEQFDLSGVIYQAQDTGDALLAAIAGGIFSGALYSFAVRAGGSTGGTDIAGAFINHKYPEYDTVWIIFALNVTVASISFFVYGRDYKAVILCAVFVFVGSLVSDSILKGGKAAAKFEIITSHPEELSQELMQKLNHGCTLIPAKGMYTGTDRGLLVCVVSRRQVVEFERILQKYDNTFAFISTVSGTIGHFKREKH